MCPTESDPRALHAAAGLGEPVAVPIKKAAEIVGLSRGQFYREFLTPGRISAVRTGKRDRIVILTELHAAFEAYIREKRAPFPEAAA